MAAIEPLGFHHHFLSPIDVNLYRQTSLSLAAAVALLGSRTPRSGRFRAVESPAYITYYFEPRLFEDRSTRRLLFRADKASDLTRDEKLEIRALRKYAHWTYAHIAVVTSYTQRQVQTACTEPLTPRKRRHHDVFTLTDWQQHSIRDFLLADRKHLKIPWGDLCFFIPELAGYSQRYIESSIKKMDYRRTAKRISLQHDQAVRNKHKNFYSWVLCIFPKERCNRAWWLRNKPIVFSDEILGRNSPCSTQFLTIHQAEDPDIYALARRQKNDKWMFWGAFAGNEKMPYHVWGQGTKIDAEKYVAEIVPLIDAIMDLGYDYFMQNNAPAHRAAYTQEWLRVLFVKLIEWPPYSPDLNSIENVWAWMKNWLDVTYDLQSLQGEALRDVIVAAWEAVPDDVLENIYTSFSERCQKCLDADGGPIDF